MIDFRLRVFCSVAHHLSFTKASKELLVSQPAISKHIQELEAEYETRLFERKSSGIALTPAGVVLLTHAEEILRHYRQLDFEMNLHALHSGKKLRLGASPAIIQQALSGYLIQFRERGNPIEISLLCDSMQAIEEAVAKGKIELGIVESTHPNTGLCYTPFSLDTLLRAVDYRSQVNLPKEEFYFVQKSDTPNQIASAFMHYLNPKI